MGVSAKQNVKSTMMGFENTKPIHVPRDIKDMRAVKREKIAYDFTNKYMGGQINSKAAYAKQNHISIHTLNKGLKEASMMSSMKGSGKGTRSKHDRDMIEHHSDSKEHHSDTNSSKRNTNKRGGDMKVHEPSSLNVLYNEDSIKEAIELLNGSMETLGLRERFSLVTTNVDN